MHETTHSDLRVPLQAAPVDRSPTTGARCGDGPGVDASTLVGPSFPFEVLGRPWRPPYGSTGGFLPNGWGAQVR
jgi:hypothetical protein